MKYLSLLMLFAACHLKEDITCKYQGAVIYDTHRPSIGPTVFTIKYEGKMLDVAVWEIDAGQYRTGDTINKPCI